MLNLKCLLGLVLVCMSMNAMANCRIKTEHIKKGWDFEHIMKPSRFDVGRNADIFVEGNEPIASCLSLKGLTNGIMPRECRLLRDFFCFTNANADGGKIIVDLKTVQPITMVNTYSAHGPVGGTTWCEEFDGSRGPQVYSVYGSAVVSPDFENLDTKDWTFIANVDTRPSDKENWVGQYGVNIEGKDGGILGNYRWIVFDVKSTLKKGADNPLWTDTWYAEIDVHTAETQKKGGDFIFTGNQLDEMIIVYKTHFDIGFTHPAPEIVNIYRMEMIDKALDNIDESNSWPKQKRFSWTIPAWVAYQILYDGQDSVRLKRIVNAIKSGRLVVHGLPVTVHTESLSLEDIVFSLSFNKRLSEKLGIPMSRAGKMTDVPSHSWILPTVLKNAGIDFLHIGVNPLNERPDVPLLYKWEGPDGSQLLTMHTQGYGSDTEFGHGIYPPVDWPYKHWLAMIVSTDNAGAPHIHEVENLLNEIETNMPNVHVRFGKMEDFADAIMEEERKGAVVPVIRKDMPDCWIHGIGTMPKIDSIAHDTRERIVAAKVLNANLKQWGLVVGNIDTAMFRAQERSLMFGEHTWGGARNLEGKSAYGIEDFEEYIKNDDDCKWLTKTWQDHADYMLKSSEITDSLIAEEMKLLVSTVRAKKGEYLVYNALPWNRDICVEIPERNGQRFFAQDVPACGYKCYTIPSLDEGKETICDRKVIENSYFKISLDRLKGGIVSMINKKNGMEMVDTLSSYAFGTYVYEHFDSIQNYNYHIGCSHLNSVYGYNGRGCRGWNVRKDLPSTPLYQSAVAQYDKMVVKNVNEGVEVVLEARPKGLIRSSILTTIFIPEKLPWIELSVSVLDKKPEYWPEAGSICFPVNAKNTQFRLGRLGGVVNPVDGFAKGSNRTYGCLDNGALIAGEDGKGVGLYPLDNGLMSFGSKGICEIDPTYVPDSSLAKVMMFNTIWTINFPYWTSGDFTSRVRVWGIDDVADENLVGPSLEAKTSAIIMPIKDNNRNGLLPSSMQGISLSAKGARITSWDSDGTEGILRIWNMLNKNQRVTVTLPCGGFVEAVPVNLRGEKIGKAYSIKNNQWTFEMKANAPCSFMLKQR